MTVKSGEPAEGTVTSENLAPPSEEVPVPVPEASEVAKSNEDVALEVIAGRWGRGHKRKKKLEEAGYDPAAIKEEVAKIKNQ